MSNDFSKRALLDFLDYLANKGLVNKSTISARKAAANALLDILDDDEASDVRRLDVEALALRFSNLKGDQFTPASLNTYKSRFSSALEDFLNYRKNPLTFKPGLSPRVRRKSQTASDDSSIPEKNPPANFDGKKLIEQSIPVQIRENVVVQIVGLPVDLKASEAHRISKIVGAYVYDDED